MQLFYPKNILLCIFSVVVSLRSFAQTPKIPSAAGYERRLAAQKAIDERKLKDYFAKKNIQAIKAAPGIYYTISKEGTGSKILAGETVTLNYTGRLLDGTAFDSNTDPKFHHVEPYVFETGKGSVIRGYDKGVQLLRKGTKATIYIPSGLAYEDSERPGIPANSILIFEVEILDVSR